MTTPGTTPAATPAQPRVAIVTGASSGIGEATARTLASQGFHVVAVARRGDRLQRLADEIGGTAAPADVTDVDAIEALAAGLSRVDVLVNNATSIIGAGCGKRMCSERCTSPARCCPN
jgi:NADP-dependent 3-hydroxy acid dehydrogenase YdfG